MHLFSHILTTLAHLGTQILPKKRKKIHIMQIKCILFCLRLDKICHISLTDFRLINWLSSKESPHQCLNAITLKFVNNSFHFYLNEFFELSKELTH